MDYLKCGNCGQVLTEDMNVCPTCGHPISGIAENVNSENTIGGGNIANANGYAQPDVQPYIQQNVQQGGVQQPVGKSGKKVTKPQISLVIGVLIILMGIATLACKAGVTPHYSGSYNVGSAVFGADFYTEIYGASDTIVDALDDIDSGVEILSNASVSAINAAYFCSGMIIISLGLGVVAVSLMKMG